MVASHKEHRFDLASPTEGELDSALNSWAVESATFMREHSVGPTVSISGKFNSRRLKC